MDSVDVKHNLKQKKTVKAQTSGAVCDSRGGRPGLPVPNSPYGRKATFKETINR